MKYKRKSFPEAGSVPSPETSQPQPQLLTQPPQPSTPGGKTETPPRGRPSPYDQAARGFLRRTGKLDILERHARGLRDSFRKSVAEGD